MLQKNNNKHHNLPESIVKCQNIARDAEVFKKNDGICHVLPIRRMSIQMFIKYDFMWSETFPKAMLGQNPNVPGRGPRPIAKLLQSLYILAKLLMFKGN